MADMEVTVGMKLAELDRGLRALEAKVGGSAQNIESMFTFALAGKGLKQFSRVMMESLRAAQHDSAAAQRALEIIEGKGGLMAEVGRSFGFAVENIAEFIGGTKDAGDAWNKFVNEVTKNKAAREIGAVLLGPLGLGIPVDTSNGDFWRPGPPKKKKDDADYLAKVEADKQKAEDLRLGAIYRRLVEERRVRDYEERVSEAGSDVEREKLRAEEKYRKGKQELLKLLATEKNLILDADFKSLADTRDREMADAERRDYLSRFTEGNELYARMYDEEEKRRLERERTARDREFDMRGRSIDIQQIRTGDTEEVARAKAILEYEREIAEIHDSDLLTEAERMQLQAERSQMLYDQLDALSGFYAKRAADKRQPYGTLSGNFLGAGQSGTLRQVVGASPAASGQQAAQAATVKSEQHLKTISSAVTEMARRPAVAVLG